MDILRILCSGLMRSAGVGVVLTGFALVRSVSSEPRGNRASDTSAFRAVVAAQLSFCFAKLNVSQSGASYSGYV